ncbi:clamp-binding protein CrfC, partial [Escherichia coli]|nr:clamp-binding protein CrfC [Escherichia coli]
GNVDQVPLIEVEFTHLAGLEESKGQISILDTPGPNESGQPHLASMLKEQLSKASAVISVVDYTQIGSEADGEVRELVSKLPTELPLYVFINKIDGKKRNGDSPEEIKRLIVDQLMKG